MEQRIHMKWWILLLLCIPVIYLSVQLFVILYRTYETQTIVEDTLSDSIMCRGILGMGETEIPYDGAGFLGYAVEDGARVTAGNVVAYAFPGLEQAQQSAYAEILTQELSIIEKSNISPTGTDTEMLMSQTYNSVYNYLDTIASAHYQALYEKQDAMQLALNKTQVVTGGVTDFTERTTMLTAQRDAAQAAGAGSPIAAPVSGYFVAGENSTKRIYTTQQLQEMAPADLAVAAQEESPPNPKETAGKIIEDYRWRFFTTVPLARVNKFPLGGNVRVSFPDISDEMIPATVENVTEDEQAGIAKIELLCNYINAEVITLEHTRARITFRDYEGLRIDKRALRVVEGIKGVYIRHGNVAYFRRIKILYEDENYLLVPLKKIEGENEVNRYDEAFITGQDLYNEKIL